MLTIHTIQVSLRYASVIWLLFNLSVLYAQDPIDRKAIVDRHAVTLHRMDTLAALSVGNGRFAFTVDATGLQSFPLYYQNGIPLGTQSEWGWHSFPNAQDYRLEESIQMHSSHGRKVPYTRQWPSDTRQGRAANYFRQNPHRLQLANIGWRIQKKNGAAAGVEDITDIQQTLDCWSGEIRSSFKVEGERVEVLTLVSQEHDLIAVKVRSKLLEEQRLGLGIVFPSPSDAFLDNAVDYRLLENQELIAKQSTRHRLRLHRRLDSSRYELSLLSSLPLKFNQDKPLSFGIQAHEASEWTFTLQFSPEPIASQPTFDKVRREAVSAWEAFWNSGGMIDLGKVDDPRAKEIERRMVLSLYQTRINCAGNMPPQETGLVQNSWFGKPHLEMAWWHGVHFALWGRPELLEKQMLWYLNNRDKARALAQRQGFSGLRWQKMTDPWGNETPSSVGAYLVWQQPHPIYFAELLYRARPVEESLRLYANLVEETADFMADFVWYDSLSGRYILGPGLIPAQERFVPDSTINPVFELAYWRWGLQTAQAWRERLGQKRNENWDRVLEQLSPLPEREGLYLAAESAQDSYLRPDYMTDHPIVLGTLGMLPVTEGLDMRVMLATFEKVWKDWHWEDTWGWDFPLTAMTATRLNNPEYAIQALLMPIRTNTYLPNGHNYQDARLRLYLPGNGGFLAALAMMCGGYDGSVPRPGFPSSWEIRWEGLLPMP